LAPVSIHAPAIRRDTVQARNPGLFGKFQSTRLRLGATPRPPRTVYATPRFQSTRLRLGATARPEHNDLTGGFQSTRLRLGATGGGGVGAADAPRFNPRACD